MLHAANQEAQAGQRLQAWSSFDGCEKRLSLQISLGTSMDVTEDGLPSVLVICAHVWQQGVDGTTPRKVLMAVQHVSPDEIRRLAACGTRRCIPAEHQGSCSAACHMNSRA